ncbi:hypothetical protein Tco_0008130 [Tanacetum coccineum]
MNLNVQLLVGWIGLEIFRKYFPAYRTKVVSWDFWIKNNGQEGVADEEFSDAEKANNDDEQETAEIFRIETNLFAYETPGCTKLKEFNFLLTVDSGIIYSFRDRVILKVSPWKRVVRFGKWGKLNPRYVGPFKVLEKVGVVSYKLELPQEPSRVHNTFHVSNLKKCYADEPLAIPLDGLHIDDKLQFVEEPVEIMDHEVKRLKQSRIPIIKVRWNSKRGPEFTWEREDQFQKKYPHLFTKTAPSSSAAS